MSITIDMTPQELAVIKQLTKVENDAEAVLRAAREYVRLSRLRELTTVFGKVDFESNWQELEQLELDETPFPQ